jgi:cobalt-zinc-cadmium efflux system membrane fusion protein
VASKEPEAPPPTEVWLTPEPVAALQPVVEPLDEKTIVDTVLTAGKIAFDDGNLWHGFSPVSGRVIKVEARVGQQVKKGDPLARIESPDMGQASSDVSKALADVSAAKRDYDRAKNLWEERAISTHDLEVAEDTYLRAQAELQRAQQKIFLLRGPMNDAVTQSFVLKSGMDGEVLARAVSLNYEVAGLYGGGTPVELFTVGDVDHVWLVADIYEQDLPLVTVGVPVTFSVTAFPDQVFKTTVSWVSSTLDPVARTAKIRCIVPNADRKLRPEMFAVVKLQVTEKSGLGVPRPAILRIGDKTGVFVDDGETPAHVHRYEWVPVSVDEGEGDRIVRLVSGPPKGAKVVVKNAIKLSSML